MVSELAGGVLYVFVQSSNSRFPMQRTLLTLTATSIATCLLAGVLSAAEHTKEPLSDVKENLESGKAVLIDVREQREWDQGHLAVAKLKPLSRLAARNGDPAELLKDVPKDKIIYCHCRSGGRALAACDVLKDLGFDVRALKPGFAALVEAGFAEAKQGEDVSDGKSDGASKP